MIIEIIDNLPLPQRLCIYYYYYEHLTVAQIAENLGANESTVRTRLAVAREKIRKELEQLNEEEGIKLYSAVPLMLTPILNQGLQEFDMPQELLNSMLDNISASAITGVSVAGTGATTSIAITVMGIKTKIAIIAASVIVAIGITTGVLWVVKPWEDSVPVIADTSEQTGELTAPLTTVPEETEPEPKREEVSDEDREALEEFLQIVSGLRTQRFPIFDDINDVPIGNIMLCFGENSEPDIIYDNEQRERLFDSDPTVVHGYYLNSLDNFLKENLNPNFSIKSYNFENFYEDVWPRYYLYDVENAAIAPGHSMSAGQYVLLTHGWHEIDITDMYKLGNKYYVYVTRTEGEVDWGNENEGEILNENGMVNEEPHLIEQLIHIFEKNENGLFNIVSIQLDEDGEEAESKENHESEELNLDWVNAYKEIINSIDDLSMYASEGLFLYDLDEDEIPELFIDSGSYEIRTVYSFKNGKTLELGNLVGSLFKVDDYNGIYSRFILDGGHSEGDAYYEIIDDKLVQQMRLERSYPGGVVDIVFTYSYNDEEISSEEYYELYNKYFDEKNLISNNAYGIDDIDQMFDDYIDTM